MTIPQCIALLRQIKNTLKSMSFDGLPESQMEAMRNIQAKLEKADLLEIR